MILRFLLLLHIFIQFTPNLTAKKCLHLYICVFFRTLIFIYFFFGKSDVLLRLPARVLLQYSFINREITTSTGKKYEKETFRKIAAVTRLAYELLTYLEG